MKDAELNRCEACGHDADQHGPDGRCLNVPDLWEACTCERFIPSHQVTTRVLMDAQYRVFAELLDEHPDPMIGDEGRPYWRPSMLGMCLRRQVLWRRGVPETRIEAPEDTADKLRRFAWGRALERKFLECFELAGVLIAPQVHLVDEDLEIQGSADILWGGIPRVDLPERSKWWSAEYSWAIRTYRGALQEILADRPIPVTLTEVKSTHSHAVRKAYKEGPRIDYRCQLGCYGLIADRHPEQVPAGGGIDRFELVVVGRDAVRPLCFGLTGFDRELAHGRLIQLGNYWRAGSLPPCTCGHTEGLTWETKYCPFQNPEDPSECCQTTLLDRLEASVDRTRGLVAG